MRIKFFSILILVLFFTSSCVTQRLWENTNPDKYVQIDFTQITEDKLVENGVKYIRDNKRKTFYVEKNSFDKLKDYTYRALGTPFTLVLDTISIAIVVAGVGVFSHLEYIKTHGYHTQGTIDF